MTTRDVWLNAQTNAEAACNLGLELRVLSDALWRPSEWLPVIRQRVRPEDFWSEPHRRIYEALLELERAGTVSAEQLAVSLNRSGQYTPPVAQALWTILAETPIDAYPDDLAEYLVALSRQRRAKATAAEIASDAKRKGHDRDWLRESGAALVELGNEQRGDEPESWDAALRAWNDREPPGIPSGLTGLQRHLDGYRPACLYVVGARPGVGKTVFGLHEALRCAKAGHLVCFVNCEMTSGQMRDRAVSCLSGVPLRELRSSRHAAAVTDALGELGRLPFRVFSVPRPTVSQIAAFARDTVTAERMRNPQATLGMVVVDHMHILSPPSGLGKNASREQQLEAISGELQGLAMASGVPVVALAQLNRESERGGRREPQLTDLRGSGAIEQDAYAVVLLHRPGMFEDAADARRHMRLLVVKNRQGPTGGADALFTGSTFRVSDDPQRMPEPAYHEQFDPTDDLPDWRDDA